MGVCNADDSALAFSPPIAGNQRVADIARDNAEDFIAKWQNVTASELSTSQSFLSDLCRLLGVDVPHPTAEQDYMYERPITFSHGDGSSSAGRIDLYRRGAFVLESKKVKAGSHTKGFDDALLRARSQAEGYARALPAHEGRPPFVVVVDVGQRIELYAEFTRSGATYTPFPDPRNHRIALDDLRKPDIRERLRRVWTDPTSLDPSRESARVTREIARQLADLARSLEKSGHEPTAVAQFLMRCLFTMFAEDVKLLPQDCFRDLLVKYADQPDTAMRMVGQLWRDMDSGGFSAAIASDVLRFNGKLFKSADTLPLDTVQVGLLATAARSKWEHVEPAIFGTLLERALAPDERHKLGAHYTPRAYVERLVLPTVMEPLRAEWSDAQAAALTLAAEGKPDEATAELLKFHHRLCSVRVLDPACGSGNFLYVTLEHLKRLEGEVLNALDELGHRQAGLAIGGERADAAAGETVDPHNLLGIELNPRAAAIAEVVLWIGYLQWHYRTRGNVHPPVPVIRDFRNIENRDAVLAYDRVEYVKDERGVPITRWDGKTMKPSPVTGEDIPDESARVPLERYVNPRKAAWPQADFVVGNPPFIGNKRMRIALGDGYVDALRGAWTDVPESADFVMYWWHHAAMLTRRGALQRFGLITTNGIRQAFNRQILTEHMSNVDSPISIIFAVPDHPWVDAADGAAVRIAMTVAIKGVAKGTLSKVEVESADQAGEANVVLGKETGKIFEDLRTGVDVVSAGSLKSNSGLASRGVTLVGQGFVILEKDRQAVVDANGFLKPYITGRSLAQVDKSQYVLDFYNLTEDEVRATCPAAYQWVLNRVKPERLHNNRPSYRQRWWTFAEPRAAFRKASFGLMRIVLTPRTAKHRFFKFEPPDAQFESEVVGLALEDAAQLGVLSSAVHFVWVDANAASFGVYIGNIRYNQTRCFDPFPFPDLEALDKFTAPLAYTLEGRDGREGETVVVGEYGSDVIRTLAEQLDTHRKRQQAAHPDLTLTGMYNVLDKLRSGEPLTAKERVIHEQGLVSVLRQIHDDLDAAVLSAYGWSDLLPLLRVAHGNDALPDGQTREDSKRAFDEAVLERLVALNAERAAEEARGHVRWLRPEFQAKGTVTAAPTQGTLDTNSDPDEPALAATPTDKPKPWPKDPTEQVRAVADLLAASPVPMTLDDIGNRFTARGPWKRRLPQLLDMLVALGRAHRTEDRYARE